MNVIERFQNWYKSNCEGDRELIEGIRIYTIDNPGWSIEINLIATNLESKDFKEIKSNYEDDLDWYRCWVEDKKWRGVGSPQHLETLLKIFLEWAQK